MAELNSFSLPITVRTNHEYIEELKQKLEEYVECLKSPDSVYEKENLDFIEEEYRLIMDALDSLINGCGEDAEEIIANMLDFFMKEPFLISDLDKSYSFRGIAPFDELRRKGYDKHYDKMMEKELTFYRVRTKKKDSGEIISDEEHMLHLPYNLRDKAGSMRFSTAGVPGLYLGTTTYMCSKEVEWNGSDELYASVFIPESKGKKLKILNLTVSQALINGIYGRERDGDDKVRRRIQNAMLKIFPLVIATSFSVESEEKIKYHYLLSQTLMKVVAKKGIDGIAYLSMKGDDEFQYPQGVNLAIPANDISDDNLYSKKCKAGFRVSKPILYCYQNSKGEKSYINENYPRYDSTGYENFTAKVSIDGEIKFYGDTSYAKFDDYLVDSFK